MESPVKPEGVVTTVIPQSRLSGADIAQPYESLARGLDAAGQGLEQLAVPLAEQAGAKAVTRDADGNIQVERMPIFGLAGNAFGRAIKIGALAEADGEAQRKDIELRQQFRDNPQGYLAAADSFKQEQIQKLSSVSPEVGVELGRTIDHTTTQTYRGLLNEKERLDLQRADSRITAGINSATDDAVALARGGADKDGADMQGAVGKLTTLLDEKLRNPRLAYTQEQHDLDIQQFQGELAGARNLYHVDQVYKNEGYQAAVEAAKDVLTNPDYKLTPAQRQAFFTHSMGEIRTNEAIRHQDISDIRTGLRELSTASTLGGRIEPNEIEDLRNRAKAAGWQAGVATIDAAFAHKDLHDGFGKLPIDQQTQELNGIRGAAAARAAYQYFVGKGYRPEEASGIVGNLIHESGMNPAAMGDQGTSGGLAQFHNERLANLKAYAASVGKPAGDFQTQLEFIDKELHGSEAGTLAKLQGARTPEEAAQAFINYERPQGYTPQNPAGGLGYANRQALARSVFQGSAADGSGGPGVQSWLIANRAHTLEDSATREWKDIWDDWSSGKGGRPSQERLDNVIAAARTSGDTFGTKGNIDLQEKISRGVDLMDYAERIKQLPLGQQAAAETELRRRISLGQAPFPGAELVQKQLEARAQAIQSGLQSDPISTSIANFPDKFKTPPPLNLQDPAQLVAGLKQRAQIAQIAAANWQSGPLAAMDSQDAAQMKAALQSPDPAVKAGIYGAIAQLPEDIRGATLRKLAGNEPAGMAEAAAGSLMTTAPDIAGSIFRGQAAMKTDKRYDPTRENEGQKGYFHDLDKALPASTFTQQDRTAPDGAYATMAAMVKARYADLSAQAGDTNYAQGRLQQAVTDVTGGILSHNGGSIVAPARGMSQGRFDSVIRGVTDSDLAGVTTLSGRQITPAYLQNQAQLESVGEGKYLVKIGSAYAMRYAGTESPSPFVLNLQGRAAAPTPGFAAPANPL